MEIVAKVGVVNRRDPIARTFRSNTEILRWSTISLRREPVGFFIDVEPQGNVFKIKNNVRKYDKSNVEDGFLRIGFHEPGQDLLVCCAPAKLKMFFRAVEIMFLWLEQPLELNVVFRNRPSTSSGMSTQLCRKRTSPREDNSNVDFMLSKGHGGKILQLYISGKMPHSIDARIFTLAYLSELHFFKNRLTEIPEAMGSMPNLKVLNLKENHLGRATNWKWLTSPIIRANLKMLDLSNNELTYVSEHIMHLTNLERLYLTSNFIKELPMSLGNLKKLRCLNLSFNQLRTLPGCVLSKLHNRNKLNMSFNKFTEGLQLYKNPKLTKADFKVKTLFWAAAEVVVRTKYLSYDNVLPATVADYLQYKIKYCYCGLPIFDDNARLFYQRSVAYTLMLGVTLLTTVYICSYKCYKRLKSRLLL